MSDRDGLRARLEARRERDGVEPEEGFAPKFSSWGVLALPTLPVTVETVPLLAERLGELQRLVGNLGRALEGNG